MKLYFAGTSAALYHDGVRNRLLTFADRLSWQKKEFDFWIQQGTPPGADVFLDSGAFAAHTRGAVLDLHSYCDYIEQHADRLSVYAALDVIGSWRKSYVNLDLMLKRGLSPLPVFHSGEPMDALHALLSQHKHIALGGMASDNPSRETLRTYLDQCFHIVGKHWPVRVHGFGIMAQWALERYPFYSVDSSSAIISSAMGMVSTFTNGTVESTKWRDYARRTLDGAVMDHVAEDTAKGGSAHRGRRVQNIKVQLQLQAMVTRLWETRGITWTDV